MISSPAERARLATDRDRKLAEVWAGMIREHLKKVRERLGGKAPSGAAGQDPRWCYWGRTVAR